MNWSGLPKELRRHGLRVQVVSGWKSRSTGTARHGGVLWHDDVTPKNSGDAPALGYITNNKLYNIYIGRSGKVYIIGAGKASHGGLGGPYRWIPRDSANSYAIGVAFANAGAGREKYGEEQLRAGTVVTGVLLRRMGKGVSRTGRHRDYAPRRKIDTGFGAGMMRNRVKAWMSGFKPAKPKPKPKPKPKGPRMLRLRDPMMRGSDVRDAQRRLRARGFSPGSIDGVFGRNTERAVRRFQRFKKLDVDGIVGPKTWRALGRH